LHSFIFSLDCINLFSAVLNRVKPKTKAINDKQNGSGNSPLKNKEKLNPAQQRARILVLAIDPMAKKLTETTKIFS
jgi:hypothetical protein